ncbi:MAG: ScaI family restriction endonuclease [Pirellulaceae bacterium]|nr:ScaI family restriction endonuclease [Pirellulaceae bacterium]
MTSPYAGLPPPKWEAVTRHLIDIHPLAPSEIVDVVLLTWKSIFESRMGTQGFRIGVDIFPKPQVMGFLLHELVPLELASRHPRVWRAERTPADKDLVHIPDDSFSVEIKTSSNPSRIFGNRSYAQSGNSAKKAKDGYYLAVNFGKFTGKTRRPPILRIRFGWLDSTDWIGQKAATGQQSRLAKDVENFKLLQLYPKS